MNFRCPQCRYEFDVRQATKDAALIEIIKMQSEFAGHGKLVFEYLELFYTTRPMKAAKLLRLLIEVRDMWTGEKFAFQKRVYGISKAGIVQALKTVCNKRFEVPLENHNYLKKVMISIAEEESKKNSAEAERALREKEARLRITTRPHDPEENGSPTAMKDFLDSMPWRKE